MVKILIILPNQLFIKHDINFDKIILYEHPKFFTKYNYHKAKLVFHRSTMMAYYDLMKKKYNIEYVQFNESAKLKDIFHQTPDIVIYDPVDFDIFNEFKKLEKQKIIKNLTILESKLFILNTNDISIYINSTNYPYINASFYKWIRIYKNILVRNNLPYGGKWTYDIKNRLPFDNQYIETDIKFINNSYITEAKIYIEKHFKKNIGVPNIFLPISHKDSKKYFDEFLKNKLNNFGPYEDAISSDVQIGYHSSISALLNIGLIDPNDVINETIEYAKSKTIKIESLEGFIRQIISWREYVRILYIKEHDSFNKTNFLKHRNKLSSIWYTAQTGIIPVDNVIKKALNISYCHHIERLMIIGNFMLLCQLKPSDVYKWFIEVVSIDAYEWVMEPNVYGMSQHSAGKLMMTRPYYSSSNYIFKMSNYKKSNDFAQIQLNKNMYHWYEVFDALYYNFIDVHQIYLSKIYATSMSVSVYKKKSSSEKNKLKKIANLYMKNYL